MYQAHAYIKGDVIGVGFRAWTKIQAKYLGVKGWVKNVFDNPDFFGPQGGVETVLQADDEQIVKRMIDKIKIGSPVSQVDEVKIQWEDSIERYEGFEIIA